MTDKKTIIDDVDVSGCKYWKGYCRIASLCDYSGHLCEVTPNCYYKQLKRKEQECEELKKQQTEIKKYLGISHKTILERLEELTDFRDADREQLDQLKTELEKYKQLANSFEADFYNALSDKESNLLKKYKQALEEIREIQKDCEGCKGDCCYCYSGSGWIFKLSDEVLKGNFEVLDE